MKSTAQKLIVISFVLALIAAVTVSLYLKSLKSPNEKTEKITVLVATETIPSGTLIEKKMINEIKVPNDSILVDYIKDSSEIVGKYTKETIYKNEGFHIDKLIDKDGNELNLKIDSNNRAISISVTGDSGVSDLLKPGDYVDLVAYIAEKKDGAKVIRPDAVKIVLQNIRILAIDKQLSREEKVNDKTIDKEKILTNFLVTLSVPTLELEKLVLAESIGSIKLALRPLNDHNMNQTNGSTYEELSINVDSNNEIASNKGNNSSNISSESNNNDNENYVSYTVKPGDTLRKISLEFYGDKVKYTIIKDANNIQDENLILNGEVIKIPVIQK